MPHIITYVSKRGKDQVDLGFPGNQSGFTRTLEVIVAGEFNRLASEELVPGETCFSDHFHTSSTIPRDIAVVVMAWMTDDRVFYAEPIRTAISRSIEALFSPSADMKIQVFLNIVGDPTGRS